VSITACTHGEDVEASIVVGNVVAETVRL